MKHINDNSLNTAGGIVLSNNKVLFIIKNDIWDLPKGKIGLNRTKLKTAKQEIHEETGLRKKDLNTIKKLVPTYYFKNISGELVLKKTTWYLFHYVGKADVKLIPALEENITHCEWIDIKKINKVFENTHERIKYILELFLIDHKNSKNWSKS